MSDVQKQQATESDERVTIKLREKTGFGELLERYRNRAGISQDEFARRMRELRYPNFGQRMYSHLIYNEAARVYPVFFEKASQVLRLTFLEQRELLEAWLSLGHSSLEEDGQDL